jgi:hypothetical protein
MGMMALLLSSRTYCKSKLFFEKCQGIECCGSNLLVLSINKLMLLSGNESPFSEEKSITIPEVTIGPDSPGAPMVPGNIRIQILFQEMR